MLKDCRYQLTIEGRLKHSTLDKPFLFWTIAWIALQGLERSPKKRGPLGAAKDVRPLGARHPRRLRPDAPTPSSALLRSTCVLRSCWWMPKNCHRGSQGPRDPRSGLGPLSDWNTWQMTVNNHMFHGNGKKYPLANTFDPVQPMFPWLRSHFFMTPPLRPCVSPKISAWPPKKNVCGLGPGRITHNRKMGVKMVPIP